MISKYKLNNFKDFGPPAISADRLNKMDIAIKEAIENRVSKSLEFTAELKADNWVFDNENAFIYNLSYLDILSCSDRSIDLTKLPVTDTTTQMFYPGLNITAEQLKALQKADIQDAGQEDGKVVLRAFGTKPSVNIPIRFILQEAIYNVKLEDVNNVEFPVEGVNE